MGTQVVVDRYDIEKKRVSQRKDQRLVQSKETCAVANRGSAFMVGCILAEIEYVFGERRITQMEGDNTVECEHSKRCGWTIRLVVTQERSVGCHRNGAARIPTPRCAAGCEH